MGSSNRLAITDPVYPVYVDTNVMVGHTGEADASGAYAGITYLPCTAQNGFIPEPPKEHVDVIYLCSPNNPTGGVDSPELVREVLALNAGPNPGLVVVDEAYGQFADWSALELVSEETPLVVTRTFSKTWSMAAARLGYLIGPKWLVAELDKVVLPYHLDTAKQIAGTLAVQYRGDMEERVRMIVAERERVVATLKTLDIEVFPSGANFVLFRTKSKTGRAVWQGLLDRSVLIRDCSGWPRLENCLRVTIGTPAEDDAFLVALTEVLK
jgi:histidinol-phosphate aminotransferase